MLRMATRNRFALDNVWLLYAEREIAKREHLLDLNYSDRNGSFLNLKPNDGEQSILKLESTDLDKLPKYDSLDLNIRVRLLHFLCELQLERVEYFKPWTDTLENEASKWRLKPISSDLKSLYYLFADSRLYKEDIKTHSWSLVCASEEDWRRIPQMFANTKDKKEKEFYKQLVKLEPKMIKNLQNAEQLREEKRMDILRQKEIDEQEEKERLEKERQAEIEENERAAKLILEQEMQRSISARSRRAKRAERVRRRDQGFSEAISKRLLMEDYDNMNYNPLRKYRPNKSRRRKVSFEDEAKTETESSGDMVLDSDSRNNDSSTPSAEDILLEPDLVENESDRQEDPYEPLANDFKPMIPEVMSPDPLTNRIKPDLA